MYVADQFIDYFRSNAPPAPFFASESLNSWLLWADVHPTNGINLLGLSVNTQDTWEKYLGINRAALTCLLELSDRLSLPVLWINEAVISNQALEIGNIEVDETLTCTPSFFQLDACPDIIQDLFRTAYTVSGTTKPVNKTTHDSFHSWSRSAMPQQYIKTDIDLITFRADRSANVFAEVKRSYDPANWLPFKDDEANYKLQVEFAKQSGARPVIIQHEKYKPITKTSQVGYYDKLRLGAGPNWLEYSKDVITASEAVERISQS